MKQITQKAINKMRKQSEHMKPCKNCKATIRIVPTSEGWKLFDIGGKPHRCYK